MSRTLYQLIFRLLGVHGLYKKIVQQDRLENVRPKIRKDLETLLSRVNENNPFFEGRFTEFLDANRDVDDDTFFSAYSQLPAFSKQDYAEAGQSVMSRELADLDPKSIELTVRGRPLESLRRLRRR